MLNPLGRPMIRAVYFDAVGTMLFPSQSVTRQYQTLACKYGADLDEATLRQRIRTAYEIEERADAAEGWRTDEAREAARWRNIVHACLPETTDPEACFRELWEHYAAAAAWTVHPEAAEVFEKLDDFGIRFGLASNFDGRLAGVVAGLPMMRPFGERVLISSLLGVRKPGAGFFAEVVRSAGVPAEQILFVGDDLRNDYQGALTAGMSAVLLWTTNDPPPAVAVVRTLMEAITCVG